MAKGTLHVGTSGYSYPKWKGSFYPRDLASTQFLAFYADRFSTVEINNTFYRFPTETLLIGWRDGTPDRFSFAIKANQRITHKGRLKGVQELTADFVERCHRLDDKLGPILFQLPPYLRRDDRRLTHFLASLPPGPRYAIEFRHESWYDEATFCALRDAGVAFCVAEAEETAAPRLATAEFAYLRLRKESYQPKELRDWRSWIEEQLKRGRDVYAYLKHDEAGVSPELALRLLGSGSSAATPSLAPKRRTASRARRKAGKRGR